MKKRQGPPIPFRELPLSNDFIFGEVMRREQICKLFLEALLGKQIARIEYINKQQEMSDSFTNHGIRLDIYLRDENNTVYSVEMQTSGGVLIFKRIRYYQGMIDRHNLQKGEHYSELPESFIIVICTMDLFGRGLALYKRKVVMEGCEDIGYDDGSHIYFLNTDYTVENAAAPIIEFLRCIRNNDIDPVGYSSQLMKEVCPVMAEVRGDAQKEEAYMTWQTKIMDVKFWAKEEGREEGRKEGHEQGRKEGREEGMEALVHALRGLSQGRDMIVKELAKQFRLSLSDAAAAVDQYWTPESAPGV